MPNTSAAAISDRSWWAGDYHVVGHWVAQFGVFALMPLFETGPTTLDPRHRCRRRDALSAPAARLYSSPLARHFGKFVRCPVEVQPERGAAAARRRKAVAPAKPPAPTTAAGSRSSVSSLAGLVVLTLAYISGRAGTRR